MKQATAGSNSQGDRSTQAIRQIVQLTLFICTYVRVVAAVLCCMLVKGSMCASTCNVPQAILWHAPNKTIITCLISNITVNFYNNNNNNKQLSASILTHTYTHLYRYVAILNHIHCNYCWNSIGNFVRS